MRPRTTDRFCAGGTSRTKPSTRLILTRRAGGRAIAPPHDGDSGTPGLIETAIAAEQVEACWPRASRHRQLEISIYGLGFTCKPDVDPSLLVAVRSISRGPDATPSNWTRRRRRSARSMAIRGGRARGPAAHRRRDDHVEARVGPLWSPHSSQLIRIWCASRGATLDRRTPRVSPRC
jgi:hypothetical protein